MSEFMYCKGLISLLLPGLPDWPLLCPNKNHKQIICGLRPPQFVVAEGHNIFEVTERLFAALGRHSSLWPKATTFEK